MQGLLVLIAAGLLMFAGYTWGRVDGFDDGSRSDEIGAPDKPGALEIVVPALLGASALTGALLLQGNGGLRMPSPARLDDLAGRVEQVAVERAEQSAAANPSLEEQAAEAKSLDPDPSAAAAKPSSSPRTEA